MSKKYKFKVTEWIAQENNVPRIFHANIIRETAKALLVNGHGVNLVNEGICSVCGEELDPNSIDLGIGQICAEKMKINLSKGYTSENIDEILRETLIETWIPRRQIEYQEEVEEGQEEIEENKKIAIVSKNTIYITFPFDSDTLARVKSLENRHFKAEPEPHWVALCTALNLQILQGAGFCIQYTDDKDSLAIPEYLKDILFPYQLEGVKFISDRHGRCLIGDEMGLGKTLQSITYIESTPEIMIILVICPASLKFVWKNEIEKWSHRTYEVISGKQPYYIHAESSESKKHYVIINYDILKEWSPFLSLIPFDCMVIDECHYIANFKSQRTKETVILSKTIDRFVALSGTPFKNRPVEFFMVLNIINPTMFPTFMDYGIRYCNGQKNQYGWDFTGSSNMDELHEKLKDIMIRRVKVDVLKELPPKIRNVVPIQILNQKEYSQASNDFRTWLLEVTKSRAKLDKALKAEALVKIEHLKQLVLKGKKKQIIQWVRDFLSVEDKLVLFGIHKSALDFLEKEFSDICVKVDGSVKDYEREKAVSDFQNNKDIKLFLGNIKAAGVGLTLTTASSTAFIELPWTPADLEQAEDRVHRIGQAKHVNSYYLIDESTIEGDLRDLIWDKKDIKDAILDGLDILPRLNRQEF